MSHYKHLVKIGSATIGIALLTLLYNFFNMYSLVGQCPDDIDIKSCQAHDNWTMLNKIGLTILVIGIAVLIIGLVKRRQNRL